MSDVARRVQGQVFAVDVESGAGATLTVEIADTAEGSRVVLSLAMSRGSHSLVFHPGAAAFLGMMLVDSEAPAPSASVKGEN